MQFLKDFLIGTGVFIGTVGLVFSVVFGVIWLGQRLMAISPNLIPPFIIVVVGMIFSLAYAWRDGDEWDS